MEVSIYHAVVSRKKLPATELFEELETLKPGLFTGLLRIEGGPAYAKLALFYIVHAYSKESPVLVLGQRFAEQKQRIADYVELPDKMHGPVVMMQSSLVQSVVVDYLNAQQDRKWQHLMQDRDMYEAMLDHGMKSMKREDGTTDFKGIVEATKVRRDFLAAIEIQEKEFREEYAFVQENVDEITELKKIQQASSGGQSMKLETSNNIK